MSAVKKHFAVFSEISNLVFDKKKNVSGIVYVPLTARLRAAYSAAYVAAYVVSPGEPTSRLSSRGRYWVRFQKVARPEPSCEFFRKSS
ncbi:MAG: hypothetical protein Q8N45_02175 [Anaerolineales bacterium]|nr:hypothetical protein [Anaerolineales bacterium]